MQKKNEPVHSYIQRFSKLLNSAEDVSVDRVIDAFDHGLIRVDFQEDLGQRNPKTIAQLMNLANKWADGEDHIRRQRARSVDDDDADHKHQHDFSIQRDRGNDRRKRRKDHTYDISDVVDMVRAG